VGHLAGSEPVDYRPPPRQAGAGPRPRLEVLRPLRRGLRNGGGRCGEDAGSCPEGERGRGELGVAPFVESASITSSSSEGVTFSACWARTRITTTGRRGRRRSDRTRQLSPRDPGSAGARWFRRRSRNATKLAPDRLFRADDDARHRQGVPESLLHEGEERWPYSLSERF
jgi:hypothetical protein